MPTGYTSFIEDGKVKNPADFLHICLCNFGVCWSMRDSDVPMDAKDFESAIREGYQDSIDYHRKKLEAAKKKLAKFNALSDEDLYRKYELETTEKYNQYNNLYAKALKKNATYDKFLNAIKAWTPSGDFQGIKDFAIQQIEISKDDPVYWGNEADKVGLPSREKFEEMKESIKEDMLKSINWDISYHQEELDKKIKGLAGALDFYHRFKEEIKSINE